MEPGARVGQDCLDLTDETLGVVTVQADEYLPYLGPPEQFLLAGMQELHQGLTLGEPAAGEGVVEKGLMEEGQL